LDHVGVLNSAYLYAKTKQKKNLKSLISDVPTIEAVRYIAKQSENSRGVFTVVVTSCVQKIIDPKQDVRIHQKQLLGGYSGRLVDTKFVTPFLKDIGFPAMVESGWLTRSLEQSHPYDANYPGKIRDLQLKESFLQIFSAIELQGLSARDILYMLFKEVYELVEANKVTVDRAFGKGTWLQRSALLDIFDEHFSYPYPGAQGAARLPVLAIYACLTVMKIQGTLGSGLVPRKLGSHTAADFRSGALGDIELEDKDQSVRIAIEVKHDVVVTKELVRTSALKVKGKLVEQLHIVSSKPVIHDDVETVEAFRKEFFKDFGSDISVFGTRQYLSALSSQIIKPEEVLDAYAGLLEDDAVIQGIHKKAWNHVVSIHLPKA